VISRWIDCAAKPFLVSRERCCVPPESGRYGEFLWMPCRIFPSSIIVHTRGPGSAEPIEDQVTYPIVTKLLAAPHVKAVRAQTMFGDSYVS